MRLLLTRAAEDAARTRVKLEDAGHRVIVSPVIEIAATGQRWPKGVVDAVLATSGQAFSVMDGWAEPSPEARRLMPLFLVGERTADLARLHGFTGPTTVTANAAMLAIAIGKVSVAPRRLVYLAGHDRKPDIETALDVIGCRLEVLEIYDARAATSLSQDAIDALRNGALAGVLHFSRRSAALFRGLVDSAGLAIQPCIHLCLSDDVAGPLKDVGCEDVRIAEVPNEAALLSLVETLVSERTGKA